MSEMAVFKRMNIITTTTTITITTTTTTTTTIIFQLSAIPSSYTR